MSKRRNQKTESTRITIDDYNAIRQLSEAAGWSQPKAVTFVLARGWEALHSDHPEFAPAKAILKAAIDKQKISATAAAKIATLNRTIREAEKTLKTQ